MIELHIAPTPNAHKVSIALEEMGLKYEIHRVNINEGDQFKPEFLAFSPNNRIPAIIDSEGPDGQPIGVFESGAILIYLAEKTGMLLPEGGAARKSVMEWLMWQMGGFGPMLGQAHHFNFYTKDKIEYAVNRYSKEANRLYGVLDRRLEGREFVADDYSIADIAIFPWTRTHERQNVDLADYSNVERWRQTMINRPAVQRGMQAGAEFNKDLRDLTPDQWKRLFGA
ncbi:glutathione binding-like protein [Alphaproteobacteria bacterium]|nr:glutathione binding-like protein [Alphaproteobacteria bacterium]